MNETVFGKINPAPPAIIIQEYRYEGPEKTIVVIGLPSGGTSAVAAMVDALGIPFVRDKGDPSLGNFEHSGLVLGGVHDVPNIIQDINGKYPVWGFKNPHVRYFDSRYLHKHLRHPYYILVSKDIGSMAIRRSVADENVTPRESLLYEVEQSSQLMSWALSLPRAPLLLLSYPKFIHHRRATSDIIAGFCGITPTNDSLQRAINRISPDGGYLLSEGDGNNE